MYIAVPSLAFASLCCLNTEGSYAPGPLRPVLELATCARPATSQGKSPTAAGPATIHYYCMDATHRYIRKPGVPDLHEFDCARKIVAAHGAAVQNQWQTSTAMNALVLKDSNSRDFAMTCKGHEPSDCLHLWQCKWPLSCITVFQTQCMPANSFPITGLITFSVHDCFCLNAWLANRPSVILAKSTLKEKLR